MKKGYIKITLKSDLCASSGYAFAGIVDNDICYDDAGIPFIPARRIKGCMKEAAQNVISCLLDKDEVNLIFGEGGKKCVNGLYVDNAYIRDYETIKREIDQAAKDKKYKDIITVQSVLDMFTHVCAQTALDKDGTADENTLRYTRAVNRYSPIDRNEMEFYAAITYEAEKEESIKNIIKAVRNIGLKRNRGFGFVKCELVSDLPQNYVVINTEAKNDGWKQPADIKGNERYIIKYMIRNDAPLVLSNEDNNLSAKYINGGSILGFIASGYIRDGKNPYETSGNTYTTEFADLFLNGKTVYSNLYISDGINDYFPAPEYLAKKKKSGVLSNTFYVQDCPKSIESGDQPKRLKGKFVHIDDNEVKIIEPKTQIVYHHTSVSNSKDGENPDLYSHEALSAGQFFSGNIITYGKYIETIKQYLGEEIRLGKSKTAQYGKCSIISAEVIELDEILKPDKQLKVNAGDEIVIALLSDAAFINEGGYTIYGDEIKAIIGDELKLDYFEDSEHYSLLQTRVVYGYNTQWNLRKEPIPVIQAGSCIVYKINESTSLPRYAFVGEKNTEGFGAVQISQLTANDDFKKAEQEEVLTEINVKDFISEPIIRKIVLLDEIKKPIDELNMNISASSLGRVTLMLKESLDEFKDDYKKAFEDFGRRVESIKKDSTRNEIRNEILKKYGKQNNNIWILNDNLTEMWGKKLMYELTAKKFSLKNRKGKRGNE